MHSGLSYSIVNGCGFLAGLIFGKLSVVLKKHLLYISVLVTAAGFLILYMSGSLPVLYGGSVLLGVGLAWFLPQTQLLISNLVEPQKAAFAYGVNSAIGNAGQFLSALILNAVAGTLALSGEREMFLLALTGYVILIVICVIFILNWEKVTNK